MKLYFYIALSALIAFIVAPAAQAGAEPVIRVVGNETSGESPPSSGRVKTFIRIIGDRQNAAPTPTGKLMARPKQDQSTTAVDTHGSDTKKTARNGTEKVNTEQENAALAATIERLAAAKTASRDNLSSRTADKTITAKKVAPSKKATKRHKKRIKKRHAKCVCR